jgi:hypothetical protein
MISKIVLALIFPSSFKQNPYFRSVIRTYVQQSAFHDTFIFTINGLQKWRPITSAHDAKALAIEIYRHLSDFLVMHSVASKLH